MEVVVVRRGKSVDSLSGTADVREKRESSSSILVDSG